MATQDRAYGLLQRLTGLHVQLGEEIDQLENLLLAGGTERTPGQKGKAVLDAFCGAWGGRYGEKYLVSGAKDMGMIKRLLKDLTVGELEQRIAAYIRSSDPFYVNARHPLALFVANINKFGSAEPAANPRDFLQSAPADCRHRPPCRTDVEHTRRRGAELRS